MKVETPLNGIWFSAYWLIIGLPYLLYTGAVDIGYYFIVLKTYNGVLEDDEQEQEDEL